MYFNALPGGINSLGIIFKNFNYELRDKSNRLYEASIAKLLSEDQRALVISNALALTGNMDNLSKNSCSFSLMKDRNNAVLLHMMSAF